MPFYDHKCHSCQEIFEDFYSSKDPIPSVCPNCKTEGQVQRLISLPGKGIVELSRQELKQHIKEEAGKAVIRARTDENFRANLVGEQRYQSNQVAESQARQEAKQFKWGRRS